MLVGSVFLMYTVSSVAGFYVYHKKDLVDLCSGIILSIPTVPGVIIRTLLETGLSGQEFKLGLRLLVSILGVVTLLQPNIIGREYA